MKNKIIIFTGAISSGGAEKQSILLAKVLQDVGYKITIISFYGEEEKIKRYLDFIKTEKLTCYYLNGNNYQYPQEKHPKSNVIVYFPDINSWAKDFLVQEKSRTSKKVIPLNSEPSPQPASHLPRLAMTGSF